MSKLELLLKNALNVRQENLANFFRSPHQSAFRIFNGYSEGFPDFVVEIFAKTLVIYPTMTEYQTNTIVQIHEFYFNALPWLETSVIKPRSKKGISYLHFGSKPDHKVEENGVWYALDLLRHQDSTLYLDTRNTRKWIFDNLQNKTVLNTFAYTGSLGAAARVGGATRVIQTDLDSSFLNLAKQTYLLNNLQINARDFIAEDFFKVVAHLKSLDALFDCIILDPPFFSKTQKGNFDLNRDFTRLINKIRPLIAHNGFLIAIQNAVFVSGQSYLDELNTLCLGGYAHIADFIPVPLDFIGAGTAGEANLPANPAPFNHSTKIAVLQFKRKDGRPSSSVS